MTIPNLLKTLPHWFISVGLVGLTPFLPLSPGVAGTCASDCGEMPLQFEPAHYVEIEVINRVPRVVYIQEAGGSAAIAIPAEASIRLERKGTTQENLSLTFWDELGLALKARLSTPETNILQLELLPDEPPGHRSIYLRDDGQVDVF